MKVELLRVLEGAKYENTVLDYWLYLKLASSQVIKVFDPHCISKNSEIGYLYNVKLTSSMIFEEIEFDSNVLFGEINETNIFFNDSLQIVLTDVTNLTINQAKLFAFGRIDLSDILKVD